MISKYNHKGLTWIDLESPSEEELSHIMEQYPIPIYIKEKITSKSNENIVNIDNDFIFTSLYSPQVSINKNRNNKLISVVNDNFVLTIHNKPIKAFDVFSKEMESDIVGEETLKINDNKLLFAYLLKNLYLDSQNQLVESDIKIKDLRKQIVSNNKKLKLLIILSIMLLVTTIIFICL